VFQRVPEPPPPTFQVTETVLKDELADEVDVVACITAYHAESVLEKCLDHLRRDGIPSSVCINGVNDAVKRIALDKADMVVELSKNCGYGHGMNTAAKVALLHKPRAVMPTCADAFVGAGTVPHAWAEMQRLGAGCVGTTHITASGVVNSHGSEWAWRQDGGEMRQTRQVPFPLPDPVKHSGAPVERDFLTFANIMVRADVWEELGGLDERYAVGYWEDVDFCARARKAGHQMYWVGGPTVTHLVGQGGGGGRNAEAWNQNAQLFRGRFEDTGLVDKWARRRGLRPLDGVVTACVIACNEEEFIKPSIESVYDFVDRVIVVVGGCVPAQKAGMCTDTGMPIDQTVAMVKAINDHGHKIEIVYPPDRPWWDKGEQREAYAKMLNDGDWMFVLDADEVFTEDGLWRLSRHAHFADVVIPGHWVIWNNFNTVGTGIWNAFPHRKIVKWRAGYTYKFSHLHIATPSGQPIFTQPNVKIINCVQERLYVHYAWVRPLEKIQQKMQYYMQASPDKHRVDYFKEVFLRWRTEPLVVESEMGTHPRGRGGVAAFPAEHPPEVQKLITSGVLGGDGW